MKKTFSLKLDPKFYAVVLIFGFISSIIINWAFDVLANTSWIYLVIQAMSLLFICGYCLYLFFTTKYELIDKTFYYRSGLVSGSFEVGEVREMILGRSFEFKAKNLTVAGTKGGGLIIRGEENNAWHITPANPHLVIQAFHKIKPDIQVIDGYQKLDKEALET
jgi:hypothetical protein